MDQPCFMCAVNKGSHEGRKRNSVERFVASWHCIMQMHCCIVQRHCKCTISALQLRFQNHKESLDFAG